MSAEPGINSGRVAAPRTPRRLTSAGAVLAWSLFGTVTTVLAPRPVFEEEADVFAAALLMPAQLMLREYAADRDFFSMCDRFNVSQKAMSRRMHQVIPRAK